MVTRRHFWATCWQGNLSGVNVITGDSVTWTKGRHNFTFGGDFRRTRSTTARALGPYPLTSTANYTAGAGYPYDGFAYATFLLGLVGIRPAKPWPTTCTGGRRGCSCSLRTVTRPQSKLTLSMGLRWNYNFRFHEKYGNWANFDRDCHQPDLWHSRHVGIRQERRR